MVAVSLKKKFFQAEDGIRDDNWSRGLGDVYKRQAKKTAFVVEHDFIMATYLADRVVVFEGQPSIDTKANS